MKKLLFLSLLLGLLCTMALGGILEVAYLETPPVILVTEKVESAYLETPPVILGIEIQEVAYLETPPVILSNKRVS